MKYNNITDSGIKWLLEKIKGLGGVKTKAGTNCFAKVTDICTTIQITAQNVTAVQNDAATIKLPDGIKFTEPDNFYFPICVMNASWIPITTTCRGLLTASDPSTIQLKYSESGAKNIFLIATITLPTGMFTIS